jgi:hypothetical protein
VLSGTFQARDGLPVRVAVAVLRSDRDDGNARANYGQERRRRGRTTAVMRHLEDVRARQAAPEQDRVDPLLDVAHQ